MDRLERLRLLETKINEQNVLGKKLVEILRQVSDDNVEAAAAALPAAIDGSAENQVNENFVLLLATSFVVGRFDIAGQLLTKKFCPTGRVAVQASNEIGRYFIALFEKVRHGEIRLTFSDALATNFYLEPGMVWLTWVMPLLVAAANSTRVTPGKAYLNQWDAGVFPGLAYCASGDEFFLIPDNVFLPTMGYRSLKQTPVTDLTAWPDRMPIAFWRGATTGQPMRPAEGWRSLQRVALAELSLAHPRLIDAGLSKIVQMSAEASAEIASSGLTKSFFPARDLHRYRYLIDVDGNTNAWAGFFERLLTGSPILKVASPRGYRQWYYDRLHPWHNFVPIAADLSDLVSKVEWLIGHDDDAREIGQNGRALALSIDYDKEVDNALDTIGAAFRADSAMLGPTLREPATTEADEIATHHGTLVAYNVVSKRLVHASVERCRQTRLVLRLTVHRTGDEACLRTEAGDYIIDIADDGKATLARGPGPRDRSIFRVVGKADDEDGAFSLQMNDKFACAERDGKVTISRDRASAWETFRLMPKPAGEAASPG